MKDKVMHRILDRISIGDGCWDWTHYRNAYGYGIVRWNENGQKRYQTAHRWMYETFIGKVPTGLDLDHLCRNRTCVRPDHLEPVTRKENLRRSNLTLGSKNSIKTHCPNGHEYDEANTFVWNGHRHCRACRRERAYERLRQNRG